MNTAKRISTASLLAAAALTFAPPAWSLGLGDMTVESFLNQPLQVKIDLLNRETDDLTSVTARLASAADYELIGSSLESVPVPIRFSVEDIEGDAYILATSSLPIGEPVVRLIVEVNWSSGRLLREYTVFLDPPVYTEPAPIPRIDQRQTAAPAADRTPPEPVEATPQASQQPPDATPITPAEGEYGPVAEGENLWNIAANWSRGTGLNMNQVMIAIQRENPQAFLKDNINLLKRGAILRMPRVEDVRTISTAAAINEVSAQTQEFRSGKSEQPATSPMTPLLAEEAAAFQAEEETAEAEQAALEEAEEQAVPEKAVEQDVAVNEAEAEIESAAEELTTEELTADEPELSPQLELVPPSEESDLDSAYGFEESQEDGADASVTTSALREDLARTEEELITQQQQNEYLAERIRELESQLASAEEGNVESPDMANMEDRLRRERLAGAADKAPEAPWYGRFSTWLIAVLVLAVAAAGWFLRRRGIADEFVSTAGPLREIKDEAEAVLRVLRDPEPPDAAVTEAGAGAEPSGPEEPVAGAEENARSARPFGASGGEAELLDEESSDPEIQLDLARAYISMGDREAARVILDEVGNNGNEEQREEARKMLSRLNP